MLFWRSKNKIDGENERWGRNWLDERHVLNTEERDGVKKERDGAFKVTFS